MRTFRYLLLAAGAGLLLCGCGAKGPSAQSVRVTLEENLPPHLAVEDVKVEFIPGGDDQGVVRAEAKVRLTEDLFEAVIFDQETVFSPVASERTESSARERAEQNGITIPPEMEKSLLSAEGAFDRAKSAANVPVIRQTAKQGDEFSLSMKGRAVREGKTWTVLGLSGNELNLSGGPRLSLPPNAVLESDAAIQNARDVLARAGIELEQARAKFSEDVESAIREKQTAAAKEIADRKAALKDTCTKEPIYGVWNTESGRGEIGLRFTRFEEIAEGNILVEGVLINPANPRETKLFTGMVSGNGTTENPYSLRMNVPKQNGVAAQWDAARNTTTGLLLDQCKFNFDFVFDRDMQRLRGSLAGPYDLNIGVDYHTRDEFEIIFSKSFVPASGGGKAPKTINEPASSNGPSAGLSTPPNPTAVRVKPSPPEARRLREADIAGWDAAKIQKALNELYAGHGLTFKDKELQAYFDRQPWYRARPELSADQVEAEFSEIETANKEFLAAARSAKAPPAKKRFTAEETKRLEFEAREEVGKLLEAMESGDIAYSERALESLKARHPNCPIVFFAEIVLGGKTRNAKRVESAYQTLNECYSLSSNGRKNLEEIYGFTNQIIGN